MIKLKTYIRSVDNFLKYISEDCEERGITILVSLQDFVKCDALKTNGYYDDVNKVLAVSVNKPLEEWLRILVHEYAHSLQHKEKCKIWLDGQDSYTKFFNWQDGSEKLSKKELDLHCRRAQMIELDCERRALKLISKFKLPLDKKEYCKKGSSYIYFYLFLKKMGKWYKIGHEPYRNERILSMMPDNLDGNYNKLSKQLMQLYMECI
jgi:hypothetical protein